MKKSNFISKKNWIIFSIVVINVLNSYFTYPFFYSNDGAAYLSSARSIFTKDAFIAYEWIREPGYPLFLKYINEFLGRSGNYVILIQSILLVLSIIIVAKIYESYITQNNRLTFWIIVGIISVLSQIYFQYSGIILQQSIFAFLLSLYAWLINKSYDSIKIFPIYVLLIAVSVNISILFYYFNFLYLFIVALKQYQKFQIHKIKFITILLFIPSLVLINILSIKPWENYKQKTLEKNQIVISLEKSEIEGDTSFTREDGKTVKVKLQPPSISKNFFEQRFSSVSLNSLNKLLFSPKNKSENYSFLKLMFQDNFDCGGNVAQGAANFTQYSQFYFLYSCKNGFLRNIIHTNFLNIYFYVYMSIIGMLLIFSIKEIYIRRLNFTIVIIPFLFIFLYYLLLLDVDRYIIPTYPFALSIVAYNLVAFTCFIKNKFNEIGKDSNL